MFAFIRGKLIQASPVSVIVEAGGIGYSILVPPSMFSQLPQQGQEVLLHTSFIVREISQTLYGFLSIQERDLFEQVLNVSGIGPKIALSLIGHLSIEGLNRAIHNNDVKEISRVPGIGKKTAERLIIEMRDRLKSLAASEVFSDLAINAPQDPQRQKLSDAMNALINLGYNQVSAQKAIKQAMKASSEEIDLGTLITESLSHI